MSELLSVPEVFQAELIAAKSLSPRVRGLTLRTVGRTLAWQPGQYVEITLPIEGGPSQPYSIASAALDERPGELELAVSRGTGAGSLDELPVGSVLGLRGPLGSFVNRTPEDRAVVYIANGTGVAPLRAMLQAARSSSRPSLLLFGCRTENEILWRDDFDAMTESGARFRFEPTLSRPLNGWSGRIGYVQEHLAELVPPLGDADVYVCGLADMVNACVARLTGELGVAGERIFTEAY